jgi:hypothetical protein
LVGVQAGAGGELEPLGAVRTRQNRRHSRAIESWLISMPLARRSQSAGRRLDQWVTPAARSACGGGVTVAGRISLIA